MKDRSAVTRCQVFRQKVIETSHLAHAFMGRGEGGREVINSGPAKCNHHV